MTCTMAAHLQLTWKRRTNPSIYEHATLECETNDADRYLTGMYHSTVCGMRRLCISSYWRQKGRGRKNSGESVYFLHVSGSVPGGDVRGAACM